VARDAAHNPLIRRVSLLALLAACGSPAPRPLAYDAETCSHCHMTLADRRFGAELVLTTGRIIPFDDTGCLITFLAGDSATGAAVHSIQVTDFLPPHALLDASTAVFLVSDSIRTPMDYHIAALPAGSADSVRAALGGELVTWDQARALIRSRAGAAP
jgi:copper chaperone NosL